MLLLMADWKCNKKYKYIAIILFRAPTWRVNGGTARTPAPLQNAQLWTGRDLARTVSFHSGYCFCSVQQYHFNDQSCCSTMSSRILESPDLSLRWSGQVHRDCIPGTDGGHWLVSEREYFKGRSFFSILPQNGFAKITPFLNTWKVNPEEFLGVRLLQIIEGCSSKASGESAAILATVGSSSISLCKNQ